MRTIIASPLILLSFLLNISLTNETNAQQGSWVQKANYGGGEIYDPFSFVIGNKAYVGTGRVMPGMNTKGFWEYDVTTDTWTQKANFMGTGRYGARGFALGGYGYAGTGWDPSPKGDFYRYDPAANSWSPVTNFGGSARYTSSVFSISNFGFLGLGYAGCKSDFWRFNPTLNSWTQVAAFPGGARQVASSFVINGEAYVGLGACLTTLYQNFYKYNPISNSWTLIAPFPGNARSAAFSFAIGDFGFVGGGFNYLNNPTPYQIFTDFWAYNSVTDSWLQLPDFPGGKLFASASFSMGNRGYVGMGSDTILNTHFSNAFWEYRTEIPLGLSANENEDGFTLFPSLAQSDIYIQLNHPAAYNSQLSAKIVDINGREVYSIKIVEGNQTVKLDISPLASGIYFCVISSNGTQSVKRFMKQ